MSTSISALTILVPDLPAARRFYCDVLGFTVQQEFGPDLLQLEHAGCAVLLSRCDFAAEPAYPAAAQVALGLAVADLEAEAVRMRAAGVPLVFESPQEFPAGRFLPVRDPAGNVIELLQFNR